MRYTEKTEKWCRNIQVVVNYDYTGLFCLYCNSTLFHIFCNGLCKFKNAIG